MNIFILTYAIIERQYDVALELIKTVADTNKTLRHVSMTPLMLIVGNKYKSKKIIDNIDGLLDAGADPYIKFNNQTAIDMGNLYSKKKEVQYILDKISK